MSYFEQYCLYATYERYIYVNANNYKAFLNALCRFSFFNHTFIIQIDNKFIYLLVLFYLILL